MSFTYVKSKRYMLNKSTVSCLSKIACQQGRDIVPKLMINQLQLGSCCTYSSNLVRPINNFFWLVSPVACYYGLKNTSSRRLLGLSRSYYSIYNNQNYRIRGHLQREIQESLKSVFNAFRSLPKCIQVCALVTIVFGSFQLVPVSNRVHMAISGDRFENVCGTLCWENEARENAANILSPLSPESIRVHRILKQILQATHDGLGLKNDYNVSVYVPREDLMQTSKVTAARKGLLQILRELFHSNTKNVQVKTRRVRKLGLIKYGTEHLDGLNWEVMVVNSYTENATYLPNGKIIFYTGWFKGYEKISDEEIATILAHEIGHGLARHASESMIRAIWLFALVVLPLSRICYIHGRTVTAVVGAIVAFFSRRSELEADYIGMMLMAAAGYDPQHAPKFYKKHGGIEVNIMEATHPSGETRAKKLKKVKVMRKALDIYKRVQAGHQIETFI